MGFKFVNGVMTKVDDKGQKMEPDIPLAILATPDDIMNATEAYGSMGQQLVIPQATISALENTDSEVLDILSTLFAKYEVPIGLLHKLIALKNYDLVFVLDDSGSMSTLSNLTTNDYSSDYMRGVCSGYQSTVSGPKRISRWDEEEDRLHLLMDFLVWIPTGLLKITFMNRANIIIVDKASGLGPQALLDKVHTDIRTVFSKGPAGGTPIKRCLDQSIALGNIKPTMIYLFTDGQPSDATIDSLKLLCKYRPKPINSPITFVSCTDEDAEVQWMKDVEEDGDYMSEIDDYVSERKEVLDSQGSGFPYTRGLWIMSLLVSAINPYDLDALDDEKPMRKSALSEILGYTLSESEYMIYWNGHPKHNDYSRVSFMN
jgi:hypothetical protein